MKEESKLKVNITYPEGLGTYQRHRVIDFTLSFSTNGYRILGRGGINLACGPLLADTGGVSETSGVKVEVNSAPRDSAPPEHWN